MGLLQRRRRHRLTVSCGDGDAGPGDSTTSADVAVTTTTTSAETTTTIEALATTTTTTIPTTTTNTEIVGVEQPAIWPAADVVFATPQEAATGPPRLQAGDARSGEIEVFSPGESNPVSRGLVFLRQLGPSDGWFVLGAANPNASITVPDLHVEVVAGPLTVGGVARGFEATVVVTAFLAGDADAVFDEVITGVGAFELPSRTA